MKNVRHLFILSLLSITINTNLMSQQKQFETITLGAGCFWCTEAVFQRVKGVISVESGYSGGGIANPTYREVTSGLTGHAEVIQVVFDPEVVSLVRILEIFWRTHDPTTLNRQGADVGTQYRSAIFYHSDTQGDIATKLKQELEKQAIWDKPVVTEITAFDAFYKAEDYHQDYYNQNPNQPYCQFVIVPKLEKFEKFFSDFKTE
jgi:peptide-methionine (S)-S-oxide reductase